MAARSSAPTANTLISAAPMEYGLSDASTMSSMARASRVIQTYSKKVAQCEGIRRSPGDPALRINAFEVPDQQQAEIDARRQARTAHRLGVKAGALGFDEIV